MENTVTERLGEEKNSGTEIFENSDSRKQLLARSRYLLYKSREKWTLSQKQRATILFAQYPDLEKADQLTDGLRKIYSQNIPKSTGSMFSCPSVP